MKSGAAQLVLLLPSWVAFAWLVSRLRWFWEHLPELNFGWIVLLLCGYLFWEAWPTRPVVLARPSLSGILLLAVGFPVLLLSQIFQASLGMNAACMCALAMGAMLVVSGNLCSVFGLAGLRRLGFPFGFVLIALPMPGIVQFFLVGGLKHWIAWLNVELLNLLGVPAQRAGNVIQLAACRVGVDEACSGILSLQASVMATLFIGYLSLRRFLPRLVLLCSGVALALAGNVIRSFYLSWTANEQGSDALKSVHDRAGWSILTVTALGVMLMSWALGRWENRPGLAGRSQSTAAAPQPEAEAAAKAGP